MGQIKDIQTQHFPGRRGPEETGCGRIGEDTFAATMHQDGVGRYIRQPAAVLLAFL